MVFIDVALNCNVNTMYLLIVDREQRAKIYFCAISFILLSFILWPSKLILFIPLCLFSSQIFLSFSFFCEAILVHSYLF